MLQLLTFACRKDIPGDDLEPSQIDTVAEQSTRLENGISEAVGYYGPLQTRPIISKHRNILVSDLHRIACLIYVNRGVHRVSEANFRHQRLVREGILLLAEMVTCQNAWPLFIIASEANDDEQRLTILEVFKQTQHDERRRMDHIDLTQQLVEAVWKQQDLREENPIDYLTILGTVIGAVPFIPPFA